MACSKRRRRLQETLYKTYYGFGMSVCLRYTKNREDALEILHDSFLKVFENLDVFDQERPFIAWFRQILVNTAVDNCRRTIKHKAIVHCKNLEELATEEMLKHEQPSLLVDDILKLFKQLPDMLRITYNLYVIEGYSHDEIADILDISPGTSRSNLSRAKKMLRSAYIKERDLLNRSPLSSPESNGSRYRLNDPLHLCNKTTGL